ncbi:TldD/PmbA family protein [Stagnihabitans tardus]|uniref:TldD/PmbA family protein n=1 Tax=Stagnihabitans tardus TaxID=2699202 RepID=A0AAE4Y883_9RHOB|nr:TldD/PmbA family protein [Stagnihabitans tardus]NBZ86696.1 TldD/PmbA family protein [Stagnihabitans tardus]
MHDLNDLTARLLAEAKKAGAQSADAIAVHGQSQSIDIRKGALEQAERAEGVEVGLRVLIGHRQACVSASDVSASTLARLAERAVAMAREAPEDPTAGLADPDQLARDWDAAALELSDPAEEPSAAALEAGARAVEAAAMRPGVVQVEASGGYSRRAIHLAMSNGFSGGYGRTSHSLSAVAFVGEGTGMERDWAAEGRIFAADMPGAEEIGARAAERALARLGASKPPTGAYPVVFDERVASSLVGHLIQAVNGSMIVRGTSWLRDKLGAQVLPKGMSVIEDPLRKRIPGSRPFDGEGLATKRRVIVDDGVLAGWTLDLATGRKLGMASTGNASRGTGAPPSPSTTNIDLTPGGYTREDLLAQMGTGLLVTSLIGSTINPTTGDYSRGASGFWVENGQIIRPVNECTIAGNLIEMLGGLIAANDAKDHHGTRVPSLLVQGLMLAGE